MEHPARNKGTPVMVYEAQKRKRAEAAAASIMSNESKFKGGRIEQLTGNQMLALFDKIIGPSGLNLIARNQQTIDEVGKAKKQLTEAAKGSRILQIDM